MAIQYSTLSLNSTNVRELNVRQQATRLFLTVMWHGMRGLTERIIGSIFFAPGAGNKLSRVEKEWLETGESFNIMVNGKVVRCMKTGRGPAVLFVHGWNGRGIHFHPFFEPLAEAGYSSITFDAPGHGMSEGRTSSYFEFTDAVRALLRDGRHDIRCVVAHSIGGAATINALDKEDMNMDAVLIAPALKLAEILTKAFDHYGVPESIWRNIIKRFEVRFGYDLTRDNPFNLIGKIKSRILIIHDKFDRTTPYSDSKAIAGKSDHIVLHTTDGLGHKRILGDKAVMNLVLEHLMSGAGAEYREKQADAHDNPNAAKEITRENKSIMNEYVRGDFEKRLLLFLEHRALRNEFMEIDMEQIAAHNPI